MQVCYWLKGWFDRGRKKNHHALFRLYALRLRLTSVARIQNAIREKEREVSSAHLSPWLPLTVVSTDSSGSYNNWGNLSFFFFFTWKIHGTLNIFSFARKLILINKRLSLKEMTRSPPFFFLYLLSYLQIFAWLLNTCMQFYFLKSWFFYNCSRLKRRPDTCASLLVEVKDLSFKVVNNS